jgi:RNA polymerase sigma factor (sigma-70 family)
MSQQNDPQQLVDHLFRRESGKMVAVLTRLFGFSNVDTAQDIVQETLLAALHAWRFTIPDNPRAWLYRAAKNRAMDHLRRQRTWQEKIAPNVALDLDEAPHEPQQIDRLFLDPEIEDSQLRMLFACCHPDLAQEGQIALILKTLCGLSVAEIAAGFLTSKDNIEKRLYRTREKIRQEGIALEVPQGIALKPRLEGVLKAIYLLFNEGYHSASDTEVIRRDLCEEALHLADLLTRHSVVGLPKAHALHALLCFQASRLDARMDDAGQIVLLEHQDRSRWDQTLIARGFTQLSRSAEGGELSEYHLEAAIASYHAQATSFEATNWQAIFYLYQLLYQQQPGPVVAFNRAIAMGYAMGAPTGLEALLAIDTLGDNHFYHAALGDFYQKTGAFDKTKTAYTLAFKLAVLPKEKKLLLEKIARLEALEGFSKK